MPTLASMKRLWVHEILRVFSDRLVDEVDINWLILQLHKTVKEHMETDFDALFEDLADLPSNPSVNIVWFRFFFEDETSKYVLGKNYVGLIFFNSNSTGWRYSTKKTDLL